MQPEFSIIIPVYNVEEYLRECLNSVLNQEYDGMYEVICVNDGSTDGSLGVLKEYAEKYSIIRIINQENKGLSEARNAGIKNATGDYIFFLDSDDWIESNTLKILSENVSGEDFIAFNGRRYFEDGTVEEPDKGIIETNLSGWDYYNKYALVSRKFHFVCVVLRLYKRTFLLDNDLFFGPGLYHEDNLFTPIACYYAKKIKVIPDVFYVYRIRGGSISQTANLKRLTDIILVANKLSEFFIPKKDIDKTVVYKNLATYYPNVVSILKKNNLLDFIDVIYKDFDMNYFKEVSKGCAEKIFYQLVKNRSSLIFLYPKINKVLRYFKIIN